MAGKKSGSNQGLGKALIRRRHADKHVQRDKKTQAASLQSVMEFTDLQIVLEQAEEAGRIFSEANPPVQLVASEEGSSATPEEKRREELLHESSLTVPRRPKWHQKMSTEQLDAQERQAFLAWRRSLARLEENEKLVITPFEKNLEVWRQLWRVIERCDLVVMVVDARNPLFYRCPDLEAYVKELDESKKTMLLLNKSDLLPVSIRKQWAAYFDDQGIDYVFWSAKFATDTLEGKDTKPLEEDEDENVRILGREELLEYLQKEAEDICESRKEDHSENASTSSYDTSSVKDSGARRVSVGFVGYPNVGKSSTINVLVGQKRTGVTSTPGKTKHFQTLIINEKLMLCDCPGLVFPSFTSSKADMVAAGVLPVDKMTDYRGPIQIIANQIPRKKLEELYGLQLPKPKPYEDQNRPPTAAEFLKAYAQSRGYVISSGLPDETRSARQILKDYLNGKLLYCHEPPEDAESVEQDSEEAEENDESDGSEDEVSQSDAGDAKKVAVEEIFKEVDLNTKGKAVKVVRRAPHKMHKKTPRRKDRSWRLKDDDKNTMAQVKGVATPVSYGAAR